MSIVSNNIKYLRRLNGLTQEQFSRKIGIKRSLLGAYEEARANPNLTNLKNMAHAFGVSVDQLLKNDLRRLRETPDLGLPFNPAAPAPPAPLMREVATIQPQPLAAIVTKFQPPKPTLRLVARPIALKPIHREHFTRGAAPVPSSSASAPLRFNNHYEPTSPDRPMPREEPKTPEQTIQWVKRSDVNEYLANHQNAAYLQRLPYFQLPSLPSGHYRAFEAGQDFTYPGALLIGTFVRNWYDIKDGQPYVILIKTTGIVSRRVFNHVKARGVLLLRSDHEAVPDLEVPLRDVLEVWEIKAFLSQAMPEARPTFPKLMHLLGELREELNRTELTDRLLS
ncbi:helix-turn-helix domain-containing protein [Salmonirosea aquatica]|uniref:Helix-turn-helix domain-containing protein n=1 Tax=Salmonirosea aquatica TaxID=2654236 RepID=A0A7C9BFK3_9BACT|nr:helix-turn-helix domain-containing protein [Cytophagaceae bacterium SJW1-29]